MKYLSKSQYTRGIQCLKSLYLYREQKDLQDPTTPDQQVIFDQGTEIGILAQDWIRDGVLIKAGHNHPKVALEETVAAIAAGYDILYEAAFLHDDVLIRADIIMKNNDGSWDLYEVKSSTTVSPVYLQDVAIQRYVMDGAGFKVSKAHAVILDSGYVRCGALDLQKLFTAEDVTEDTEEFLAEVPANLKKMKSLGVEKEPPVLDIGAHCLKPYPCSFKGHCWADVPEYSVFNLANARMDKKTMLWNSGFKTIQDIPETSKLTTYQTVQRKVASSGKPHINALAIRELLGNLVYPIHHLDFETVAPAIPPYNGTHPFQQIPFQASLHVQAFREAKILHFEYLADGTKDPRMDLIKFLIKYIGADGSVVAYHKSFEGGCLKGLAYHSPPYQSDPLLSIEERLWDLADPFKKAFYALPAFKGSWSIKKVLPALIPEMTYEGMAIADGVAAMQAYGRLMTDKTLTPEERAKIMADLKVYCGQDTLAMVRILEKVEEAVGVTA